MKVCGLWVLKTLAGNIADQDPSFHLPAATHKAETFSVPVSERGQKHTYMLFHNLFLRTFSPSRNQADKNQHPSTRLSSVFTNNVPPMVLAGDFSSDEDEDEAEQGSEDEGADEDEEPDDDEDEDHGSGDDDDHHHGGGGDGPNGGGGSGGGGPDGNGGGHNGGPSGGGGGSHPDDSVGGPNGGAGGDPTGGGVCQDDVGNGPTAGGGSYDFANCSGGGANTADLNANASGDDGGGDKSGGGCQISKHDSSGSSSSSDPSTPIVTNPSSSGGLLANTKPVSPKLAGTAVCGLPRGFTHNTRYLSDIPSSESRDSQVSCSSQVSRQPCSTQGLILCFPPVIYISSFERSEKSHSRIWTPETSHMEIFEWSKRSETT